MCTVGPTRFTGLLAHFAKAYPGITLQIFEGVPGALSEKLEMGEIDVALMASPNPFPDRFKLERLFRERFVVAFLMGHRFASLNAVPVAAIDGETYLRRLSCEFYYELSDLASAGGATAMDGYTSEREDWIQNMVAGGLGICFIPEFSAVVAGVQTRPLMDPEVWRDVHLVTMTGRRHSPAVASFFNALRGFPFQESRFGIDQDLARGA